MSPIRPIKSQEKYSPAMEIPVERSTAQNFSPLIYYNPDIFVLLMNNKKNPYWSRQRMTWSKTTENTRETNLVPVTKTSQERPDMKMPL